MKAIKRRRWQRQPQINFNKLLDTESRAYTKYDSEIFRVRSAGTRLLTINIQHEHYYERLARASSLSLSPSPSLSSLDHFFACFVYSFFFSNHFTFEIVSMFCCRYHWCCCCCCRCVVVALNLLNPPLEPKQRRNGIYEKRNKTKNMPISHHIPAYILNTRKWIQNATNNELRQ